MFITLTERAADKIKGLFRKHALAEAACLRVGVREGGCSDFSYTLDVVDGPAGDDEVFASHGVRLVCDPKGLRHLGGTEIDYDDSLAEGGFLFCNPHAKGTCACGESFAV